MFSKTNLIATLVAAVWAFLGGFILWSLIGESLMDGHLGSATGLMKLEPDYFHLTLGCIILAFAFTTIYSKWARGHHSLSEGLKYGLWIAVLTGIGEGMIDYSTSNMFEFTGYLLNAVLYLVYYTVMGIAVSLLYQKLSKSD